MIGVNISGRFLLSGGFVWLWAFWAAWALLCVCVCIYFEEGGLGGVLSLCVYLF